MAVLTLDQVPRISVQEAKSLWDRDAAVFVDVRRRVEYQRGHIPGALSVPSTGPASAFWALPQDRDVILY